MTTVADLLLLVFLVLSFKSGNVHIPGDVILAPAMILICLSRWAGEVIWKASNK